MGHYLQPVVDYCLQPVVDYCLQPVVDYCLQPVVDYCLQPVVDYCLQPVVDYCLQPVVGLHINQGLNIEVKLNLMNHYNQFPHLQEEVPGLLVHRFENNQEHKGYHHNLDLVLFHPGQVEGLPVNK